MLDTLKSIVDDHRRWGKQIMSLAVMDLTKTCRGAVLGWAWLVIKPAVYIICFWFALGIGLRAKSAGDACPYIIWLWAGFFPWFFMDAMLTEGTHIYNRYPYLVNRLKFPVSAISTFYAVSQMIVHLGLMAIAIAVTLACMPLTGFGFDIHLIQVPFIALLMLLFFIFCSWMFSPLSALSKDFGNLLTAVMSPIFWISGVIFNPQNIQVGWIRAILSFNPVTFFVSAYRAAICDKYWIWERPDIFVPFVIVFIATFFVSIYVFGKHQKDVPDVL